ncbi:uncharacterized protein METZ01_LOCUS260944 [marine metagenome]|jgi:hypothetical protein|uniref:CcmD family protein n=1 Tax=marine metagenome TaxID=408172 RepID=A0A382J7P7_9ZZZZ
MNSMVVTILCGAILFLLYALIEIINLKKEVRKLSNISDYLLKKVKSLKGENE